MKLLSFSPPSIRASSGFRGFAAAFFISALAVSASGQITQQQLTQAVVDGLKAYATYSTGEDYVISTWPYGDPYAQGAFTILGDMLLGKPFAGLNTEVTIGYMAALQYKEFVKLFDYLKATMPLLATNSPSSGSGSASVDLAGVTNVLRQFQFLQTPADGILQGVYDPTLYSAVSGLPYYLDQFDEQNAERAVTLETMLQLLQTGLQVGIMGGELTINGDVVAEVYNWPAWFTGEYDESILAALSNMVYNQDQLPYSYEDDWDGQIDFLDDVKSVSDDDVESSYTQAEIDDYVDDVEYEVEDNNSQTLPIRNDIFSPLDSELLSGATETFSSSVLLTPAIPRFHIPRLEYSTASHSDVESFLIRAGQLMRHFYDVLFAVFLMWLIWREYNFYFRTM